LRAEPHTGTEILAKVNYRLFGRFPGEEWAHLFEYTIKIGLGATPSVKVLSGETDIEKVNHLSSAAQAMMATRGVE
jgi:hypothetical protein